MVYEYSWNGPSRAVSAEKVAKHIKELEKQYGEVTREVFLDSARSEKSAMHCLFEWDDAKAAEKYRLQQAQVIIASIQVTVHSDEKPPIITRAFVQDKEVSSGYLNIVRALSDEDKRGRIIKEARKEALWFKSKYEHLEELAEVIESIDEFVKRTA